MSLVLNNKSAKQVNPAPEQISLQCPTPAHVGAWVGTEADTNARLLIDASGDLEWGPGGLSDQDTLLARNSPGALALFGGNADIGNVGGRMELWACQPNSQGTAGFTAPSIDLNGAGGQITAMSLKLPNLPTWDPHVRGLIWNKSGLLAVSNG